MRRSFARGTLPLGLAISTLAGLACTKASPSSLGPDAASPDVALTEKSDALITPKDSKDTGPTLCGNGFQDPGESCDDGNTLDGDGCYGTCRLEFGWTCPRFGQPCVQIYACGNGLLSPGEACDDGNTVSGDGCSGDCRQVQPGWRCRMPGRPCTEVCGEDAGACADGGPAAVCGNGIVEPGEECDNGSDTSKTPYNGDGTYGGCTGECTYGAYCGDGVINGQEACDNGPANIDLYGQPGCTFLCTTASYCGDGIVDASNGEECDSGADNGLLSTPCDLSCRLILSPI
jgi:cysteine-rich repeat protein